MRSSNSNTTSGAGSTIHEARAITSSLQRVRSTITMGVQQADHATGLLSQDDEKLNSTLDLHKYELKSALSLTKTRLHRLKTAEAREKRLLTGALSFFTCVVVFIICRRTRIIYVLLLTWSLIPKSEIPVPVQVNNTFPVADEIIGDAVLLNNQSNATVESADIVPETWTELELSDDETGRRFERQDLINPDLVDDENDGHLKDQKWVEPDADKNDDRHFEHQEL